MRPWFVVAGLVLAGPLAAETLVLEGDEWCPHNCSPEDRQPGYLVELARAALGPHGVKVEYRVERFRRLMADVEQGLATHAVLALGRSPRTERLFILSEQPLAVSPMCFFVREDSSWTYRGAASLAQVRLGVTHGYGYGPVVDAYLAQAANRKRVNVVAGDKPLPHHVAMLQLGRSGAVLEDASAMRWALKQRGLQGRIHSAGCLADDEDGIYIGFARKHPDAERHAKWLAEGLQRLRRNGEWVRIMQSYGLDLPPERPRAKGAVSRPSNDPPLPRTRR